MDIIKKLRFLRLLVYGLATLTIIFAFNYETIIKEADPVVCGNEAPVFIDYEINEVKNKEGRKLFRTLCASCHKLDKEFIGPRLGAITERRDSIYLHNYITNQDSLIKSDPKAIHKDSLNPYNHKFSQLTEEMINDILNYTSY